MLILSDLHLQQDSQDIVLGEVLPGIIDIARNAGQDEIAILGDLFHVRYHIQVKLLNGLRDILKSAGAYLWHILPGNHDQVDVAGRNALEHLDDLSNVRVYSEPIWNEHGLWFPYRKPELFPELLASMTFKVMPHDPVIFMHQGIRGAWMNDGFQNKDGVSIDLLKPFAYVISGHYHKHHFLNPRCAYVGSPYQTKSDESGQVKGYCVWDGQNLLHVAREWGHRYHRLTSTDGTLDLQHVKSGDNVRVNARTKQEAEALGKILNELDVTHVVNVEPEKVEARLDVQDGASVKAYARAYVEASKTPLDKTRLLEMFDQVTA